MPQEQNAQSGVSSGGGVVEIDESAGGTVEVEFEESAEGTIVVEFEESSEGTMVVELEDSSEGAMVVELESSAGATVVEESSEASVVVESGIKGSPVLSDGITVVPILEVDSVESPLATSVDSVEPSSAGALVADSTVNSVESVGVDMSGVAESGVVSEGVSVEPSVSEPTESALGEVPVESSLGISDVLSLPSNGATVVAISSATDDVDSEGVFEPSSTDSTSVVEATSDTVVAGSTETSSFDPPFDCSVVGAVVV